MDLPVLASDAPFSRPMLPRIVLLRIPARQNALHAARLQCQLHTRAADGTWLPPLRCSGNNRCDAADRRLELIGVAPETEPNKTLAAGAECRSGRKANGSFIDQPRDKLPRVGLAIDGEA